jgi:hypothetical protein
MKLKTRKWGLGCEKPAVGASSYTMMNDDNNNNSNTMHPFPPPAYLLNMPDPIDTETMTMLSFYSFPPNGIDDVEEFGMMLRKVWKVFGALGRVYVAHEGVNAQMALPTNVIDHFWECCLAIM